MKKDVKNIMTGMAMATAIAGLLTACKTTQSSTKSSAMTGSDKDIVKCGKVNACGGKGQCGGKGHKCAGKNACKGKGWLKMSKNECLKKGGTPL